MAHETEEERRKRLKRHRVEGGGVKHRLDRKPRAAGGAVAIRNSQLRPPAKPDTTEPGSFDAYHPRARGGRAEHGDEAEDRALFRRLIAEHERKEEEGRAAGGGVPSKGWVDGKPAKGGGRLTAHERQALPKSSFALPGKGKGPKGAGAGSYPIPDASHARNALARVSQHGTAAEKATVRAKVHAKFPDIGKG